MGDRAGAAFTTPLLANPWSHWPNTTAAVGPLWALHCISRVGGCDGLVGGLHCRPSCAGYHNDEQNHE